MCPAANGATFGRDGIVPVRPLILADAATAMRDSIWRRIEAHTAARRDQPPTWHNVQLPSFKPIKQRSVFRPLIDSLPLAAILDEVLGPSEWEPSASGVQVLFTFPNTPTWTLPHHFWHLDTPIEPATPTTAIKVFCCLDTVTAGAGGTLALAGSHRLVDRYSAQLPVDERAMNTASMRRFLKTDPWTRDLIRPSDEPARTQRLMGSPHDADGITLAIVEMTGDTGDGYVTDIHTIHCVAPNAADRPRVMVATVFRRIAPNATTTRH
jgi:hypothetical protein